MERDTCGIIRAIIGAAIAITLLPVLLSLGSTSGAATLHLATDEPTVVDSQIDSAPETVTVEATKGNALSFDGSAYVESAAPENLNNGSWSVCLSADLEEGANRKATYDAFAYDNESILIQFDSGNWSVYYDNGSVDAIASIKANESRVTSSEFVPICGVYNESDDTLSVIRSGANSETATLDSAASPRNASNKWTGRLEEVRTFNESVSDDQLQQYAEDPIKPLPTANRSSRLMFDEGSGSTTAVYFAGSEATVHGANWTSGIEGPELDRGSDFAVSGDPFSITIVSGGYLDGSPVQYVRWDTSVLPFDVVSLMALLITVLILVTFSNRITRIMD